VRQVSFTLLVVIPITSNPPGVTLTCLYQFPTRDARIGVSSPVPPSNLNFRCKGRVAP